MDHGFDEFLRRREEVGSAYVNGDAGPLDTILTAADPTTFLAPSGDVVRGATAVASRYRTDAASFSPGGSSRFDVLQSGSSGAIGWWTGHQIAEAVVGDDDDLVPMKLRVTEVFRHEDGGWKLVHRHAEQAGDPTGG